MYKSCGILLYRKKWNKKKTKHTIQLFLIKPNNAWGTTGNVCAIPKGHKNKNENYMEAAKREFYEETGTPAPDLHYTQLPPVQVYKNKIVITYTAELPPNIDIKWVKSNTKTATIKGVKMSWPETRGGGWYPFNIAEQQIVRSQRPFLEHLAQHIQNKTTSDTINTIAKNTN